MKRALPVLFITISFLLIPFIKSSAEERRWVPEDDRSVSLFLSIEENDLYIYSDKQWDNIVIQMIDPDGKMIYMDIITIPAEEEFTIPLSYLQKGRYQVILTKDNQPVTWYLIK